MEFIILKNLEAHVWREVCILKDYESSGCLLSLRGCWRWRRHCDEDVICKLLNFALAVESAKKVNDQRYFEMS